MILNNSISNINKNVTFGKEIEISNLDMRLSASKVKAGLLQQFQSKCMIFQWASGVNRLRDW